MQSHSLNSKDFHEDSFLSIHIHLEMTVDVLILGAGWSSQFLLPLLEKRQLTYAATTRDGRNGTIPFTYDPKAENHTAYYALPKATTVLITFPIKTSGGTKRLLELYRSAHGIEAGQDATKWIQLGSTGVWEGEGVCDRHSTIDLTNARALEEEALLKEGGCVLNLAGLWGGARCPPNWLNRVAPTKKKLADKDMLHLIHGDDVAAAVLAVSEKWNAAKGQRWMVTDMRSYDWWELALAWGEEDTHKKWVLELLEDLTLPRAASGRVLRSTDFWKTFGKTPSRSLLDMPKQN
jgi:hypothetical protein